MPETPTFGRYAEIPLGPRTGESPKSETGRHARGARFVLGIATADND